MLQPLNGAKVTRRETAQRSTGPKIWNVDKGLAITFVLLLLMGLVVLYAASYYNAQDSGSSLSEVYSQLVGIAVRCV